MSLNPEEIQRLQAIVVQIFGEGDWLKVKQHIDSLESSGLTDKGGYYRRLRDALKSGEGSQAVDQAAVASAAVRLSQAGLDAVPEPARKGPDIKVPFGRENLYIEVKRLRYRTTQNRNYDAYFKDLKSIDSYPLSEEQATNSILALFGKAQFEPGQASVLLIQDWGAATPAHFYAAAKSIEKRDFAHRLAAVIYEYLYIYPPRVRVWVNRLAPCPLTHQMVVALADVFGGEVVLAPDIREAVRYQQLGGSVADFADDLRFVYQTRSQQSQQQG